MDGGQEISCGFVISGSDGAELLEFGNLARSVARLAQRSMVLSLVEDEAAPDARCRRIGPALLFERLWHEVGCRAKC